MTESHLLGNLKKVINLVDQLRDLGLQEYISMPRIAVVGSQSSGKSSLLEQIVGLDFLPRGSGVVTRRPLELRLKHQKDLKKPIGKFDELPGKEFNDFAVIKKTIEELTDKVAGTSKQIVDKPIILTVQSSTCPDLTLIDLPGITRISTANQGQNIEKITKDMCTRYCSDPKTIIMAVSPANADLANSDGLQLARKLDPNGDRTLGVLTKIDIMDKGTDARGMILGKDIQLKLGFVGIKNRSQQDIIDNKTVAFSLEQEKHYFASHPVYSTLPAGFTGTTCLTDKLTNILYKHIRMFLPDLLKEIRFQISKNEKRMRELGTALPETDSAKLQYLWKIVHEFSIAYKNKLQGKYDKNAKYSKNEIPPGSEMRLILSDLYSDLSTKEQIAAKFPVDEIKRAIAFHEGGGLPGFPSIDAFKAVLTPRLKDLHAPAKETIREIYECLERVAVETLDKILEQAPNLKEEIQDFVIKHIQLQQTNVENVVQDLIDCETDYLFTNNETYLTTERPKQLQTGNAQQQREYERVSGNPMVQELKFRLENYFSLVLKNVRDTIPKSIGYFLIKKTQDTMQTVLFSTIKRKEEFFKLMQEPTHIVEERKEVTKAIAVMKQAEKVIKRDPDLSSYSKYEEEITKPKELPKTEPKQPPKGNQGGASGAATQEKKQNPKDTQITDLFGINPTNNPPPKNPAGGAGQPQKPAQQNNNNNNVNNMFGNTNQQQKPQPVVNKPPQNNANTANNMFGNNQGTNNNNNLKPPQNTNNQNNSPRNPSPLVNQQNQNQSNQQQGNQFQSQQQQQQVRNQQQQQSQMNQPPQQQQNNNYMNQPKQNSGNNVNNNTNNNSNPLNNPPQNQDKPKPKKTGWLFN